MKKNNPRLLIGILLLFNFFTSFSQPWQRNTIPGPGYTDHNFPKGAGWDHTENICDLSVSFANPNLRAFIDNEWTTVFTEDGVNFKPLRMPNIGTPGCSPMSIEFSRHDPSTIFVLMAHDYWKNIDPSESPAGLWRSSDLGKSWQHIYKMPPGAYENFGNNSGGTLIMEDPSPLRSNDIYFGTSSHGLVRSSDGGVNWETIGSGFSNRRIKTLASGTYGDNQSVFYVIVEKKMPPHIIGNNLPISASYPPTDYSARWKFDKNLNDAGEYGNNLTGSVTAWSESAAINSYAASFDGSDALAIENLALNSSVSKFTISAWVRTTDSSDQVIASFDPNEYWELGSKGGAVTFSVLSPQKSKDPVTINVDTIGFTASEGYVPGELIENPDWTGNTGFLVDTAGSGNIRYDGKLGWKSVILSHGIPIDDMYAVGINFSFNRNMKPLDIFKRIFQIGLRDSSNAIRTSLELRRQQPENDRYALYGVNPGINNKWPGSSSFSETLLGFDNVADSTSDNLQMKLTLIRGTTLNNWNATYELWNLTKNTLVTRKDAGEFDVPSDFSISELFPYFVNPDPDSMAQVSNRIVDRFEYGSAAIVDTSNSSGTVYQVVGPRIDDGDWHYIAGVFNSGQQSLYLDGIQVASAYTGYASIGSGNTRYGFLAMGSQSNVFGDGKTIAGTGFHGYA